MSAVNLQRNLLQNWECSCVGGRHVDRELMVCVQLDDFCHIMTEGVTRRFGQVGYDPLTQGNDNGCMGVFDHERQFICWLQAGGLIEVSLVANGCIVITDKPPPIEFDFSSDLGTKSPIT